jgi:hypothetical protein
MGYRLLDKLQRILYTENLPETKIHLQNAQYPPLDANAKTGLLLKRQPPEVSSLYTLIDFNFIEHIVATSQWRNFACL